MNKTKRYEDLWQKRKNVSKDPLCPNLNFFKILKLKNFNRNNLKFFRSYFDVSTYSKRDSSKLGIGKYNLTKKI